MTVIEQMGLETRNPPPTQLPQTTQNDETLPCPSKMLPDPNPPQHSPAYTRQLPQEGDQQWPSINRSPSFGCYRKHPSATQGHQPPVFIPRHLGGQHNPQHLGTHFANVAQLPEPTATTRQILEHQQQALNLMVSTIGTTISKGLEMPRREYMTFDGNPVNISELYGKL